MKDKEKITSAIRNIDSAMSMVKATRQEHEILVESIRTIVAMANDYIKEEAPAKEEDSK